MGGQLRGALLNLGGIDLRLGRSRHTGSRWCYRKVFAHNVSGVTRFFDRVEHTAFGGIENLSSSARYRRRFVQHISQSPHLHQIGKGSLLCRLGSGALPHRPTRRHGKPMNRGEGGLPTFGSGCPVSGRTF